MKKLVNDVHAVVRETLEGFALAHPDLVDVHYSPDFVTRHAPKAEGKVGLVSGGGSGHEPLHAGFVGEGMLDAAVPGAVFTSPTPDPILEATKAADHGAGVLHIVKNYTGDVLNFETAAELAISVASENGKHETHTPAGAQLALQEWVENHPTRVGNIDRVLAEIREAEPAPAGHPRLAVISVALRTLSSAS